MSIYCYDGQVRQAARARQEERLREIETSRARREVKSLRGSRGRRRPGLSGVLRRVLGLGRTR